MDFKDYLKFMVENNASDLYFSCGAPASAKINGNLSPVEENRFSAEQFRGIACSIMSEDQQRDQQTGLNRPGHPRLIYTDEKTSPHLRIFLVVIPAQARIQR